MGPGLRVTGGALSTAPFLAGVGPQEVKVVLSTKPTGKELMNEGDALAR